MANQKPKTHLSAGLLDHSTHKEPHRSNLHHSKSAPTPSISVESKTNQIASPTPASTLLHPSFAKVALFLAIYLGGGTVCFYFLQSNIKGTKTNAIADTLYFCVVTMTTVGYGDLVPDTALTKLLACGFVFAGMALVALGLTKAADYLVEKQEKLVVGALHLRHNPNRVKKIESNVVKYKCALMGVILLALMAVGTLVLVFVEDKDLLDAFYCVCCSITTLGYGDQSFLTEGGRIFAVVWILTSTVCLGQFFLYMAELHTETKQRRLVKWVLRRRVTYQDLEAADLNNDGVVEPAEFILFKLKEMGKIRQRDISMIMEEFAALDVDQSGTISVSDVASAQADAPQLVIQA